MKLKYPPCQNCGASDYKIKSLNTYECEYCGTEYEIEIPDNREILYNECGQVVHSIPIITGTLATSFISGTVAMETRYGR